MPEDLDVTGKENSIFGYWSSITTPVSFAYGRKILCGYILIDRPSSGGSGDWHGYLLCFFLQDQLSCYGKFIGVAENE